MGFPTKVQLIDRKNSRQWYINFPSALAQAMEFSRGELVEWFQESKNQLVLNRPQAPPSVLKKTLRPGSSTPSKPSPARPSALPTCGAGFQDWSAVYRLFSKARLDAGSLFAVTRRGVVRELDPAAPLVVAMDDSLLLKRGPTIPGVAWRRDPLGPPFHTNFIRAQRVLAISALPGADELGPARAIPVDYQHAPTPRRPRNLINASDQGRQALPSARAAARRRPPPGTTLWRARSDAAAVALRRRRRVGNGRSLGGRQSPSLSRQDAVAAALASGRRAAEFALGGDRAAGLPAAPGRQAALSPAGLSDRQRSGSFAAEHRAALRAALGDRSQLSRPEDAARSGRDTSAASAFGGRGAAHDRRGLQLVVAGGAQSRTAGKFPDALPPPKWQAGKKKPRATTQDLLQRLRAELWGEGLRHFCSFPFPGQAGMKPQKLQHSLPQALLYASR